MTIHQDIYAALEKMLEPATLPPPWDHLEAPLDYRAPLRDFRAAAKSLREKFSDDDLVSSRVFTRRPGVKGAAPRFGIHPYLVVGNLLILRHQFDEPPYDFVSAAGCLSGLPPVVAALHDAATQYLVEFSGETLFATSTSEDAAILQALWYPAMPAAGLGKIKGPRLEQLFKALDVRFLSGDPWDESVFEDDDDPPACNPQPAPQANTPRRRNKPLQNIDLCLVAWHLAQLSLDEPRQLTEIDAHLRQLATQLELLMDKIYVWRPAPSLVEKLRCALTHELNLPIRSLIESSYTLSALSLISPEPDPAPMSSSPPTLSEVYGELHQDGGDGLNDHVDQVRELRQSIKQQIIDPLLVAAEARPDPELKAQGIANAIYLGHQLNLLSQLAVPESPKHRAGRGSLRPEEIDQIHARQKLMSDLLHAVDPVGKQPSPSRPRSSRR